MIVIKELALSKLKGCARTSQSNTSCTKLFEIGAKVFSTASMMLGISKGVVNVDITRSVTWRWDMAIEGIADQVSAESKLLDKQMSYVRVISIASLILGLSTLGAHANGVGENRPWQFDTSFDKANKASVADLIERKKGGYFDSFRTTNYNVTNIGTQVNCTNTAAATGNSATNSQTGNAPDLSADGSLDAPSTGNQNTTSGLDNGGEFRGVQDNLGAVTSDVDGNKIFGRVNSELGGNDQSLENNQNNSGTQSAGLDSSTACNMPGSNFTGDVESLVSGTVNSSHLN